MEIAEKTKERSGMILAVLTIVVIGLSVLFSTAQTFLHQREVEEQHLFLTSRAVFLSIERSVRRWPVREDENRLSPATADFFQALEQDGDVLFVGIVDDDGDTFLSSPLHGDAPIDLPESMLETMLRQGEANGRFAVGGREVYIYGKRLEPLRGMHMSLRDHSGPPGFLVVGIDLNQQLNAYAGFRRNVLFQGVYILLVAIFTCGLGLRFLSRREQAGRAAALERFQAKLLDNLPDGLITLGPDSIIRSANPAALSILNRTAQNLLGRPAADLPAPLAELAVGTLPAGTESEMNGQAGYEDADFCNSGASGNWRQADYEGARLEVLTLPLSNDKDNASMLILRDRTQLRNLEKNLADAEKLAAVGALAAGVAHEVRNPLSALRGFAQYFVKKLAGRQPEEEYAKTMVREADRLNRVITDLLFLGRPRAHNPRLVPLRPLLEEIIGLLGFDLDQKGIDLDLALEAESIFADADSLKQVLLNLVLNSLDALADKTPEPGERPLRVTSERLSEGVRLEVRDNGCGMSPEDKNRALEAFFTTKKKGTGLGLAITQRIMLDHGGTVDIVSEPGLGCSVSLVFPERSERVRPRNGEGRA
ncbi:MAG: PAS domain-containing protein [Desulfovibrio sp.]|jgi:signal transduction histidine kinase|nr:PAS domain-containing protein [Desulfovibrio sp.]